MHLSEKGRTVYTLSIDSDTLFETYMLQIIDVYRSVAKVNCVYLLTRRFLKQLMMYGTRQIHRDLTHHTLKLTALSLKATAMLMFHILRFSVFKSYI